MVCCLRSVSRPARVGRELGISAQGGNVLNIDTGAGGHARRGLGLLAALATGVIATPPPAQAQPAPGGIVASLANPGGDGTVNAQDLFILHGALGGSVSFTEDQLLLALTGAAVLDFPSDPAGEPEAHARCTSGSLIGTMVGNMALCDAAARCLLIGDARARGCCLGSLGPADMLAQLLAQTCVRRAVVAIAVVSGGALAIREIPWSPTCDALCSPPLLFEQAMCGYQESQARLACIQGNPPNSQSLNDCLQRAFETFSACMAAAMERYMACYAECVARNNQSPGGPG